MLKKILSIFVLLAFSFTVVPGNYARDFLSLNEEDQEIKLVVGEVSVFQAVSPQRVSIRNPEVADISKVADKEVVVIAKQVGETALTIWDKNGEKVFYIIVYPQDVERVKEKLERLINQDLGINNAYYKVNGTSGKVMVMGEVTALEKEQVDKVLSLYYTDSGKSSLIDNLLTFKEEHRMVEIDCQILELNKNDLDKLGVKWPEYLQIREEPYVAPTDSEGVVTTLNRTAPWSKLWPMHEFSRDALTARIDILVRRNKAKILSRPKLLCLSGNESKLVVGGEVPYVSASTTNDSGTGVDIEYKDYGVILTLNPTVLNDDKIKMNVSTEVSELDWANAITVSSINVPAFLKRQANTSLNVVSGDTIFIGGLIKNEEANNIDKIPALGNLPILGALFRSKQFQNDQTELVITLTPIIRESKKESERQDVLEPEKKARSNKPAIFPDYLEKEVTLNNYILNIQKRVASSLNYPRIAEEAGWQGTVKLKLHLGYDGEVIDAKVSESSGYVSFDNDVIDMAKAIGPYPPFPSNIQLQDLWIDIPIVYKMDY